MRYYGKVKALWSSVAFVMFLLFRFNCGLILFCWLPRAVPALLL